MSGSIEDPNMLAAEYVIGLLDVAEMADVRARAQSDAALRAEIVFWEDRLAPLAVLAPSVPAPDAIWTRLEREIAAAAPRSANDNSGVISPSRPGLWRSASLWRGTTAAALALAAALAVVAYLPREAPLARVAALAPLNGPAVAFLAETRPDGGLLVRAVAPAAVPPGRDLELWVLPRGATRPASLGTFPASGRPIAAAADRVPEGAQLLVSLEPAGGSPTGQPTGAVLYGGLVTGR